MPTDAAGSPHLSWNVADDVNQLLTYHFMVNALLAATLVAVTAAILGWFMVLRRESFAGHTMSVMAFPGATAAALAGISGLWGYFAASTAAALAIGGTSPPDATRPARASAIIGAVQAAGLAAGFLFLNLYHGVLGGLESLLFGTFLGVSDQQVLVLAVVAVLSVAAAGVLARPLFFASVDPELARAAGVPVRALGVAFLLLLGLAVAATSQITGVLLVFTLLVAPAATAQHLTPRPALSLALTIGFALLVAWLGLGVAYFSVYPAGFYLTSFAFGLYLAGRLAAHLTRRRSRPGRAGRPALAPGAGS
jgi:zinc/manganese transport system permease protein